MKHGVNLQSCFILFFSAITTLIIKDKSIYNKYLISSHYTSRILSYNSIYIVSFTVAFRLSYKTLTRFKTSFTTFIDANL